MKTCLIGSALVGVTLATPFSFPLANGFPNLNQAALTQTELEAGGPLPNGALPSGLSKDAITSLQLIAANEIFEVAYFSSLYNNITSGTPGYECTEFDRRYVTAAFKRIRAQEELHATGANAILKTNNAPTVSPCKYQFPVTNFRSAVALANTFTDVVLGVLPVVQSQGAETKANAPLIPLIGSILGQEAQQVGFFRSVQSKLPSAAPFLTSTTPQYALSAIKQFFVPGSCGPEYTALESAVASYPALTIVTPPKMGDTTLKCSVTGAFSKDYYLTYLSGQAQPMTVPISNVQTTNGVTTFDAPFNGNNAVVADGLIIAAVVNKNAQYASPADVAASTVYGPGLIEYQ